MNILTIDHKKGKLLFRFMKIIIMLIERVNSKYKEKKYFRVFSL